MRWEYEIRNDSSANVFSIPIGTGLISAVGNMSSFIETTIKDENK